MKLKYFITNDDKKECLLFSNKKLFHQALRNHKKHSDPDAVDSGHLSTFVSLDGNSQLEIWLSDLEEKGYKISKY